MIGFLKGKVTYVDSTYVILDVGGVGYELFCSPSTLGHLEESQLLTLWVYTSFRQDSLELFGFLSHEEKSLFLSLLKVNGVGPRMALTILGACSLEQFVGFIREENIKALTALPRVGKKTAQQIVLTLKEKISKDLSFKTSSLSKESDKVIKALENLGFSHREISQALDKMQWKNNLQTDLEQALALLKDKAP